MPYLEQSVSKQSDRWMIMPCETQQFPGALSIRVTVQWVTMLSIVRPWLTYTQCQRDSTAGYDVEHRTTLVDLRTVSA